MNDLVTPPGYVEYPRDPKFRALDRIGRLELVAKGYLASRFSLLVVAPILELWILSQPSREFSWTQRCAITLLLAGWLTFGVKAGLTRLMRADARDPAIGTFLAVALGGAGLVLSSGYFPVLWSVPLFATPAATLYIVQRSLLGSEYKRFGLTLPPFLTRFAVDYLILDLRRAEFGIDKEGISLAAPSADSRFDDVAKLESMTKGCYALNWAAPCAIVLSFVWRAHPRYFEFSLGLTLSLSLLLAVVVGLWRALSLSFAGKGFSQRVAVTITTSFAVLGLLASFGYLSYPQSMAAFFLPLIGVIVWIRQSVSNAFAKIGRPMPGWMDRYQLARYFYDLRKDGSNRPAPQPAELLLEVRP